MLRQHVPLMPMVLALALVPAIGFAQQVEGGDFEPAFHASFLFGGSWPVGTMNDHFDPGFMAAARGQYALSPMTRVGAQLGFYSFLSEPIPAERIDNEGVVSLSLIATFERLTLPVLVSV